MKLVFMLSVLFLLYCTESAYNPEDFKDTEKNENIVSGSHTIAKNIIVNYDNKEQLPVLANYFEFEIQWSYRLNNYWRITFLPVSKQIYIVPSGGNRIFAPITGYSGIEHIFIYNPSTMPRQAENTATFFYLTTDKTLFGRLECKTNYEVNADNTINVTLEYTWMVRTDGERQFPE